MCGIAGYINFDNNKPAELSVIKSMTDSLFHRGPDEEGIYLNKNLALGHRRLSIIDLVDGKQPMRDDTNNIIVFNGEIYNYVELREELINHGYHFQTNSDTEVVLKSYHKWGVDCLNKFNGMWAFALWDDKEGVLFISRDRIGEKPMFYGINSNSFVFASEIKALFSFGFKKEIRSELLELYLSLTNIPAPNTFFKGIYKLMPGHFAIIKNNQFKEYKFWGLPNIDEKNLLKNKSLIYSKFEEIFNDSVKLRMRSDVPFGAFLSGGLDSASIVSSMAKKSNYPIKTFTIGFPEKEFNESDLAQLVASKFKTDHVLHIINQADISSFLKSMVYHFDEPFGDSSCIPTYFVSKLASKEVKMVLTGDGGDEVLSGYTSYQGIKLTQMLNNVPSVLTDSAYFISNYLSKHLNGKARYKINKINKAIKTSKLPFNERVASKISSIDQFEIKSLLRGITNQYSLNDYIDDIMKSCNYNDEFYKLMYFNFNHDLPNDYLVKVDRMSMANSIETRLPFLDHNLIEFMCNVHKDIKMEGIERKSILRNSIGKSLPIELLSAPKKGFGIPLREWFRKNDYNDQLELNTRNISDLLNKNVISKIIDENRKGQKDRGNVIWTMMMLNETLK